ncbi:hypothetical protein OG579_06095 [Williamsia herbipolensis]|uniref:Secreted protein n=1 Tax=Williamsia herbipolensis TaxID=1603258 RepID=A0AAU4K5P9_9NOCA|nr:hypothetical protein [Williamsia herbipolensis]
MSFEEPDPMPIHTRARRAALRTGVAAAISAAAIAVAAAPAGAVPTTTTVPAGQSTPVDSVAAAALSALTGNSTATQQQTPTASGQDIGALLAQANDTLRKLGIQPFLNPSVAFNCVAPTSTNPFGLAPAVGGAVAGPYSAPGLPALPMINGIDPNIVKSGETLYGFVPAGITPDANTAGMQVAWFNINSGKGGFAQMGDASQTIIDRYLAGVPAGPIRDVAVATVKTVLTTIAPAGTRLAPVATGKGTVLSAVFGTVNSGGRSCFFLPMVGITNA